MYEAAQTAGRIGLVSAADFSNLPLPTLIFITRRVPAPGHDELDNPTLEAVMPELVRFFDELAARLNAATAPPVP